VRLQQQRLSAQSLAAADPLSLCLLKFTSNSNSSNSNSSSSSSRALAWAVVGAPWRRGGQLQQLSDARAAAAVSCRSLHSSNSSSWQQPVCVFYSAAGQRGEGLAHRARCQAAAVAARCDVHPVVGD
jgi:hypothetical protein